jgi:peptide-methionine (S)-S-oxide reductase
VKRSGRNARPWGNEAIKEAIRLTLEQATFGAGCFWHVEADFRSTPGVVDAMVGYAGGHTENPTYSDVCSHDTGHVEVCRVTFDTDVISFDQLVERFWDIHDPTTPDRQGPDVGSNYRSAIFTNSDEQQANAEAARDRAQPRYSRPIVTEIRRVDAFYPAEEYHQGYFGKRGIASPACAIPMVRS